MARANYPVDKVRALQRALYVAAKQNRQRRFHALYDRITRPDVLRRAWEQVRRNRGAAGIDGETIEAIEAYGVDKMLAELRAQLLTGRYRPHRRCAGSSSPRRASRQHADRSGYLVCGTG